MAAPSVKGYMPLCVTPRSRVFDEQGIGKWPMWQRFDTIKGIVDQYIDKPYRDFLAFPYHEIDKLKAEELFYWYTPRCETVYCSLKRVGDDYDFYKRLFEETVAHYQSVADRLKREGKTDDANYLQLSIKYVGESEDNIYCGDGRVVATVWGMRPRQDRKMGESVMFTELVPNLEMHEVRFVLGTMGSSNARTTLNKRQGTKILSSQVPSVNAREGYSFTGWDRNPVGVEVTGNLVFTAQYSELPKQVKQTVVSHKEERPTQEKPVGVKHHVRFLTPNNLIIRELEVEHGKRILPGLVPQLPAVDKVMCPSWDGDPLNDVIDTDRDYKAIGPAAPEKQLHTVRFLLPDLQVLSQFQLEHGSRLSATQVPPLPVVNGKVCPSWDVSPVGEQINTDRDFVAQPPQTVINVEEERNDNLCKVRFLNPDGSEIMHTGVQPGSRLKSSQIPPLPIVNGIECERWSPNPSKQVINRNIDFVAKAKRAGLRSRFAKDDEETELLVPRRSSRRMRGFWRWMLRLALLVLLVFLALYIAYLCNPCSK